MLKKQIVHELFFHITIITLFSYHIYLNRSYLWKTLTVIPSCFYFVTINLLIYFLAGLSKIGIYLAVRKFRSNRNLDRNIRRIERLDWNSLLIMSLYGLWGMSIIQSNDMQKLLQSDKKFEKLYDLM